MRGKELDRDEVIELLRPYFQLGMNVNKACASAGIPQSTVATWINNDEMLRLKIAVWQREVNNEAYRVWREKIQGGDYMATRDWLERREKDEFSLRSEVTGKDVKDIKPTFVVQTVEAKEQLEKLYAGSDSTDDPGVSQ